VYKRDADAIVNRGIKDADQIKAILRTMDETATGPNNGSL